jgi:hypothetical protein
MSGAKAGYRHRLFKAVHAEAPKRGMDHDALHDMCVTRFAVHSMSELNDAQLLEIYRGWTGKTLRSKAKKASPGWKDAPAAMVSGDEIEAIAQEFAKRGMGEGSQKNFIRRQLRGRAVIVSRRDYIRVFHALRAMNERAGL